MNFQNYPSPETTFERRLSHVWPRFYLKPLLAPVTPDEFFSGYWEKALLVVSDREPARYRALLGVSDIDFILSSAFTTDQARKATGNYRIQACF